MSSNHQHGSTNPATPFGPSRLCAAYADVLPVLDEPYTDVHVASEARAHLATCRYCQARMGVYAQLDAAIARAVGPGATPRRSTEEIMRDLLHDDVSQTEMAHTEATATTEKAGAGATAEPAVPVAAPPRGPQRRSLSQGVRRRWSGIASLAAVLAVALLAAILFAGHIRGGGPSAKATPTPDWSGPGTQTRLSAISMVSPTEGWAVGSTFPANGTNGDQARSLLLHYTNGVWTSIRLSIPGQLGAISMVSASDGWASGDNGLMLHYDGTSWRQGASPTRGGFAQVQMLSATDGWAVGDAFANGGLFHYDGHTWTAYELPATIGSVTALAMISSEDGWAIGTLSNSGPGVPTVITPTISSNPAAPAAPTNIILRFHDGTWAIDDTLTNPASRFYSLQSISMTAVDDGWVAGGISTQPTSANPTIQTTMLLLHYSGGVWHQVADPLAGSSYHASSFVRIAMRGAGDGWITASQGAASTVPVALHYDGTRWTVVALPEIPHNSTSYLTGLTYTPAGDLWAVGARLSDATTGVPDGHGGFTPTITPLILHEQHGVWSVVMQ